MYFVIQSTDLCTDNYYYSARSQFRKAQLQAKRNAEAAKRKKRELLFAGLKEGDSSASHGRRKGQEKLSQDDLVLSASSDVTAALRRTHNLMTAELERSRFAQETLGTRFPDDYLFVEN